MITLCRFCLNDDENNLCLLTESVDSFVTLEDLELFTGIRLNAEELDAYSVCFECSKELKRSTAFRDLCSSNDAHFRQLWTMHYVKLELESVEIELASRGSDVDDDIDDTLPVAQNSSSPTDEWYIEDEGDDFCSILSDGEQNEESLQYSDDTPFALPPQQELEPSNVSGDYKNTTRSRSGKSQRQLCNMCGKMVTNIMLHISSHKKETNYTCPHCPTKMTHPANLMRHIKAVHLKTIVKTCDLCGKGFTHKNTYKSHLRSQHDIGESYQCQTCSKLFKYPNGLRDHMKRFHTSDSNFECAQCAKKFTTKQALKAHENVHTNEKLYCCKHCPKQFKSRSSRNTHQLTHSGIVFSCKYCDKTYRYKTLLNIHVRKNHQLSMNESEREGRLNCQPILTARFSGSVVVYQQIYVQCKMEGVPPVISNICRFCLSQNEKMLVPLSKAVNASLELEDVERFTGIQIKPDKTSLYMMCLDCTCKLKKSADFRDACISNDILFHELFANVEYESSDQYESVPGVKETQSFAIEFVLPQNEPTEQMELEEQILEIDENASNEEDEATDTTTQPQLKTPAASFSSDEQNEEDTAASSSGETIEGNPTVTKSTSKSVMDWDKPAANRSRPLGRVKQLCGTCGKMVNNLSRHMQSHTLEVKRGCPHCPVEMVDYSNLLRHIEAVHLKKIVKSCEKCGKGFTHNNTYKSHMRSQHGIGETHKCSQCDKQFNHPGGLRDHFKRFHSNEFNFSCKSCDKQFKLKQELRVHERVHSTDKPYACSMCPKRFKSGFAKKTHEVTHSGTVFECTLCKKAYRYKALLSMHMKKMHSGENSETGD
ncbi:gastrula zinc finger protein xFG20-1-like [Anopheles stephensi]|uniref:gastrula zinc finger protein xFG20-1-like n=1 Tax=Anopheles stephensi TaxID=30069 RepID=UPI0016588A70|nr:gastrula zinc finger protein xFG20-1-like [Anopheles stephensi]